MLQLDHPRFPSLTKAFTHVLGHYAIKEPLHIWQQTASGLSYPRPFPRYLFRGECGDYATTTNGFRRLMNAGRLSTTDVHELAKMVDWIAGHLLAEREGLDWPTAYALLQHYGLPTRIVDFTGHLGLAFAFAAHGQSTVGRLAVVPYVLHTNPPLMVELYAHPWAERAQRQKAYGLLVPEEIGDLKANPARSLLNIRWYEFEILPAEKAFYEDTFSELLRESNDPSAGFLRYYITLYVEAFGKFSPELTNWLLEKQGTSRRIPMAPYCYLVDAIEEKEAVVYFRGAASLERFDEKTEAEWSTRYWSRAYEDSSEHRLKAWLPLSPGAIHVDPRTYHPDSYSTL